MEKVIYEGVFRKSISILGDAKNIYHTVEPALTAEGGEIDIFYTRQGAVLIRKTYYDPLRTVSPADPLPRIQEQAGRKMEITLFHYDSSQFGEIEQKVLRELAENDRLV